MKRFIGNAPVLIQRNKEIRKKTRDQIDTRYGGKNDGSKWYRIRIDSMILIAGRGRTKRGTWLGISQDFP